MNYKIKEIDELFNTLYKKDLTNFIDDHNHHEQLYGERKVEKSKILGDILPIRTRPRLITQKDKNYIEKNIKIVLSALKKVESAIKQNKLDIKNYLSIPKKEWEIFKINAGYKNTIPVARFDCVYNNANQSMKIWEINANSPRGYGLIDELFEKYKDIPPVKKVLQKNNINISLGFNKSMLNMLLSCYKSFGGRKKKPNIAIILWDNYVLRIDAENFKKFAEAKGYHCEIIDPRNFKYQNGKLIYQNKQYDIALKNIDLNEMMPRIKSIKHFFNAYKNKDVCLVSPFAAGITALKSIFDIFTNDKFSPLFNTKEKSALTQVVPWTRLLRNTETSIYGQNINLVGYVKKNKNKFVLKAADGTGAAEIFIGKDMKQKEWIIQIDNYVNKNWVVQEKTDYYFENFPAIKDNKYFKEKINVDILPFIMNNKILYYSRSSDNSITNFIRGGAITFIGII